MTAGPGSFVWRPIRAATERVRVHHDAISICAFSPARVDAWSHRLPPDEVGRWEGAKEDKPELLLYHAEDASRRSPPWTKADGDIDYRTMASTAGFELSRAAVTANTRFTRVPRERDEVWYLAAGEISISQSGDSHLATKGRFIFWNPGDVEADLLSREDSIVIIFSASSDIGPDSTQET